MRTPEQQARQTIDRLLQQAGWTLQDQAGFNCNAALGVAVREFSLLDSPPQPITLRGHLRCPAKAKKAATL